LAVLDRAEALVLAAEGDHAGAERLLARSRERFARLGRRLSEGRTLLALAEVRTLRGASGAEPREEALRLFRRCRALPWLRRAESFAQAAPVPPAAPAAPVAPAAGGGAAVLQGLAAMERQVAGLVMEGATNREIAGRLFVSVKTVEATLTRVYRKLGIRSRVDIVRLAAGG
jgi:DNA-binding CsgD family transcriptional regulator